MTNEQQLVAGVDFNKYSSWPVVRTPSGGTYYQVPNTAFVYDPFASAAKGKPVLYRNPKPQLDEQERVRKLQEQQASPVNQLIPVAGSVGGLIAGKYAVDAFSGTAAAAPTVAAPAVNAGVGAATGGAATSGALNLADDVGSLTYGGQPISAAGSSAGSGATSAGSTLASAAPYLGLAGAVLGADGVANAIKEGDEKSGAISGAGTGLGLAAAAPLLGFGPLGWLGFGAAALGGAGVGAGLAGLFGHESTKEAQKKRWGKLEKDGVAGAAQAYAINHPEGDDSTWKDGKYAGQKWSMDKALDLVKEDPTHFHHVYGNYKTFGNDWSGYSADQKSQIVARIADAGLYDSKKGDVIITNEDQARKIKDEVLGGKPPAPKDNPEIAKMGKELARKRNEGR